MSEERSFKIIEGEDQTPIHDLTEPTSTLHVIWEEVEAGGRGYRGESAMSRIPLRDEESRGGAIENLPTNLTAIPLYDGNRIEWKEGSNTVLFRGRIGIKDYSRGRQAGGRAREIVLTAGDMNQDLTEIIVDGWARPAETDVARVQALVSTYLSGNPRRTTNINQNYVAAGSNTVALPAKVYDATDPATILAEIASIANKLHFVTVDQELFYDGNDSFAYQAGLRISDRINEINYGEGLSCTPATGTPEVVSGVSNSNTNPIGPIVPANTSNAILLIFIVGESDQQPYSATLQINPPSTGVPMAAVSGSLHQHSVNIPLRSDATTTQWFWAEVPDTGSVSDTHSVSWVGSYIGWAVVANVRTSDPFAAVVVAEGSSANPAVTATGSGGTTVSGFAAWGGSAGDEPTIAAPGVKQWGFNEPTGLGILDYALGSKDDSALWTMAGSAPWVATGLRIRGSVGSDLTPTFPPIWDVGPASIEDGLQFLSGLRLYYGQGSNTYVYVNDPVVANKAWHAEASLYVNDDAIDTAAKATALAQTLLFRRQYDERTHNCSIGPLTTEQVGCIKPGQLIDIKAYPIPNADDAYISVRIAQLMWTTPVPGIFFAHLQLGSTLREQPSSIGPKSATDSINRHVEQGSNSHPEYVLRDTLLFQGDLPYRGASDWTRLGIGASNTMAKSTGQVPVWSNTGRLSWLDVDEHASASIVPTPPSGAVRLFGSNSKLYSKGDGGELLELGGASGGGGISGITVEDEGTPLSTLATTLDFVGAGVTASGTGAEKTITIPGGSAQEFNEIAAAVLINATSTGDAGSRADHFPGTSLDAAWAAEATALSVGPTVKYSVLTMTGPASANAHHRLRAYTPSGAFRVEARLRAFGAGARGCALLVRDSGTGDASGDGMMIDLNTSASNVVAYSLDAGTYTSRGTDASYNWPAGEFVYLAVERNGSNAWTLQASVDRVRWFTAVSGHSKTFTVAKVGFRLFNDMKATVDFFDVVS